MFEVAAVQDRMTELRLTFIGPLGSLWEGQRCSFVVSLNENFPFTRPQSIAGDTSLEHPNICPESGNVCLGVVENWNPQTGLIGVGNALIGLAISTGILEATNRQPTYGHTHKAQ